MDGETSLEKRLNSLLTVSFLGHKNMPSDECIEHALVIIGLQSTLEEECTIAEYLEDVFFMRPSDKLLEEIDKIFIKWEHEKQTSNVFN